MGNAAQAGRRQVPGRPAMAAVGPALGLDQSADGRHLLLHVGMRSTTASSIRRARGRPALGLEPRIAAPRPPATLDRRRALPSPTVATWSGNDASREHMAEPAGSGLGRCMGPVVSARPETGLPSDPLALPRSSVLWFNFRS